MLAGMQSNWIAHTLLVNVKWHSHSENSLAVPFPTENGLTIWYSDCTIDHLSQRNTHLLSQKNLYINVHSRFIYLSQKLQTTQMPLKGWMVQQTGISMPWHTTQPQTPMIYYMQLPEWTSKKMMLSEESKSQKDSYCKIPSL